MNVVDCLRCVSRAEKTRKVQEKFTHVRYKIATGKKSFARAVGAAVLVDVMGFTSTEAARILGITRQQIWDLRHKIRSKT